MAKKIRITLVKSTIGQKKTGSRNRSFLGAWKIAFRS